MKNFVIIALILIVTFSCEKVLDKELLNAIDGGRVWNDESLSELYLNSLYQEGLPSFAALANTSISDESRGSGTGSMMYGQLSMTDSYGIYGDITYGKIRNINILLSEIESGNLPDALRKSYKGQAYFLRAWQYWQLVLYHGGVPLILQPIDINRIEDLDLSRQSAAACVTQIIKDLDSAAAMIPSQYDDSDYGRVTRTAARALKGRVLLFYASPQFNPNGDQTRWQQAYDANLEAKQLADANGHSLYENYANIFLDEDNAEAIWITKYNGAGYAHGYENSVRPASVSNNGSTTANPNWDFIQSYPMADGRSIDGHPDYDQNVYWEGRDPRFYATIGYNSVEWVFDERLELDSDNTRQWTYINNNQEGNTNTLTGFYLKRSTDNTIPKTETALTGLDWIEIRYAEILINLAECANEIGNTQEAYDVLIAIRDRAGIPAGSDGLHGLPSSMNQDEMREAILLEKKIEFAFENKRHWDMRRRNLFISDAGGNQEQGYNGSKRMAIQTYVDTAYVKTLNPDLKDGPEAFDFFESTIRDTVNWDDPDNYDLYFNTIFDVELDVQEINFLQPKYNFYFMPQTALDKNPDLEQTINWIDGTFDPLAN